MTETMTPISLTDYAALLDQEVGVSRWFDITQEQIDQFAACTGDRQYIHTDPERAKTTPFGGTIAHGFLTLAMLSEMLADLPPLAGVVMSVNYGMNRMRFLSPVPSGGRIRGRFVLQAFEEIAPGQVQATLAVTIEIEGHAKPALVAEWLVRHLIAPTG
ncbi:MaoC family dehydratase [Amorphus sp. MBR-141]